MRGRTRVAMRSCTTEAGSSGTAVAAARTRPAAVMLRPPQGPGTQADGDDKHHHAHVSHALEVGPPGLEGGCHALAHDDEGQGAGESRHEAVDVRPQRRQVQEAAAGRVLWYDEDVIFAGRESAAACGLGCLAMRRRRWGTVHSSSAVEERSVCLSVEKPL